MLHSWFVLYDLRIETPPQPMLVVEADSNLCAGGPTEERGPVSIREIDHTIEPPPSEIGQEPQLIPDGPFRNHQHFIHVRIPSKDILGSTVHRHRDGGLRKLPPQSRDGRSGHQASPMYRSLMTRIMFMQCLCHSSTIVRRVPHTRRLLPATTVHTRGLGRRNPVRPRIQPPIHQ